MAENPSSGHSKRWEQLGADFHMKIGYCIAAWADVDDILFRIFSDCIGPRDQSAIIYFKTPGLGARFSLTDEIVKSVLPQPERESGGHDHASMIAWKKTIDGYQELLGTRRRIAHHPVTVRMDYPRSALLNRYPPGRMPVGGRPAIASAYEIYMSEGEKLRGRSADLPALRLKDLEDHEIAVGALASRLLAFLIDVLSKPGAELPAPTSPRQ